MRIAIIEDAPAEAAFLKEKTCALLEDDAAAPTVDVFTSCGDFARSKKRKQYEKNYCAGDNFVGPVS